MKKINTLLFLVTIMMFIFTTTVNAENITVDTSMDNTSIESKITDGTTITFTEGTYNNIHFNLVGKNVTFIASGQVTFLGDGTIGNEGNKNNGIELTNSNLTLKGDSFTFSNYQNALYVKAGSKSTVTIDKSIVNLTGEVGNGTVHSGNGIFHQTAADFELNIINEADLNINQNAGAGITFYNYKKVVEINILDGSHLDIEDNKFQGIYAHETNKFNMNIKNNSVVNVNRNKLGITGELNSYLTMSGKSLLNMNNNKGIGLNNYHIITNDSTINSNNNGTHGITNVALDSYNSTITTNENGLRGLNISGIYNDNNYNGATIINKSNLIAKNNGNSGIYFINTKGAIINNNSVITTSGNGKQASDSSSFSANGIVGSYNISIANSTINTEDKHAFATSETSVSASVWYIYENVIFTAQGLVTSEDGSNVSADIIDDYNSKHLPESEDPFLGKVYINGGSLDASNEVTVENYEKYKEDHQREDVTDTISIVNKEEEDLFRFDITQENTQIKTDKETAQLFFDYNTKSGNIITYKFTFDKNGNAYVWTPVSIVKYNPTEGIIDFTGTSSLYSGYGLNADITIFSNNLLLAQRQIATAKREGYTFEGWYYFNNQSDIELAEKYATEKNWEQLYKLISEKGTKFESTTNILTEYITIYAKWGNYGKGGDFDSNIVEIQPPQTGIEIQNNSKNSIISILIIKVIFFIKKFF